jgi:hypothetical protein
LEDNDLFLCITRENKHKDKLEGLKLYDLPKNIDETILKTNIRMKVMVKLWS